MLLTTLNRCSRLLGISWIALMLALTMACQAGPKDKLREGRAALAAQNAELAEARLQEALAADPNLVEARRLMVDVHLLREDYAKAEDALSSLWRELGFDNEDAGRAPEQRRHRQLMSDQFNELYRRWAENIDARQNPSTFEEVVKKGLERAPRSTRLNTLLVEFYLARGEYHVERGEKLLAAEQLEQLTGLRALPAQRQEALTRASNLRREAFSEETLERFERDIKPALVEAGRFDADRDAILLTVNQPVDRRLLPAREQDVEQARNLAAAALAPEIAKVVIEVGGLDAGADLSRLGSPEVGIVSEDFKRGQYTIVAAISVSSLIELGYRHHEMLRQAGDGEQAADGESAGDGEPADEAVAEESQVVD